MLTTKQSLVAVQLYMLVNNAVFDMVATLVLGMDLCIQSSHYDQDKVTTRSASKIQLLVDCDYVLRDVLRQ